MKKIYLLLLPFLFTACEDSSDCCAVVDTAIDIKYFNENGENWLNLQDLNEENIQVYFMNKGQKEKIFRSNLDAPKMISVYEDASGEEMLRLFPSDYIELNRSRTLIEFSATKVDTVDCLFSTNKSNVVCQEVWYNGQSVWNVDQGTSRIIQIAKE